MRGITVFVLVIILIVGCLGCGGKSQETEQKEQAQPKVEVAKEKKSIEEKKQAEEEKKQREKELLKRSRALDSLLDKMRDRASEKAAGEHPDSNIESIDIESKEIPYESKTRTEMVILFRVNMKSSTVGLNTIKVGVKVSGKIEIGDDGEPYSEVTGAFVAYGSDMDLQYSSGYN